ncbi:DUF2892 domain-containing protein [Tautonia rosea]|uniref:DUF2892 domain-containing protein n=1 Tax=Tautonia rosea TaxID=2728037 RepID=UPI0014733F43|nr:DUF2892 domain-containing protein [Tautonia rosea]
MIPSTVSRVSENSPESINESIQRQTEARVLHYASAGPRAIDRRLRQLDQEWDIERVLEANASSLILAGMALGSLVDRRYYVLPSVVAGFLLQHAIQGWCPPLPLFRRMGVRTAHEIEQERHALMLLRGEFQGITGDTDHGRVEQALQAVRS